MRRIAIVVFGVMILAGAWTVLWFFAAHEAGHQLDAWLASEDAQGRQWTCQGRTIGGYPFGLSISCRDATFHGDALGQTVDGSVAPLLAEVSVAHPRRVAVSLQPPFAFRSTEGARVVRGRWTSLHVNLDGLPDIASVALAGGDVVLDGLFGPAGHQILQSARLMAVVGAPTNGPDPTVAFDITVGGTSIPPLDAFLGDTQPTDLHFVGQLDQTDIGDVRTPEEAMDRWRRAGGHVDLSSSEVSRGVSLVSATGELRLDDAHRPQGRLEAELVGVQPILRRYGINVDLAAAGSFLTTLLGGSKKPPTHPGAMSLPINLQDGQLGVGPIRTGIVLPPFY